MQDATNEKKKKNYMSVCACVCVCVKHKASSNRGIINCPCLVGLLGTESSLLLTPPHAIRKSDDPLGNRTRSMGQLYLCKAEVQRSIMSNS